MARLRKTTDPDLDATLKATAERFDAVRWDQFNSSDLKARSDTRFEILNIRDDLMKVADQAPERAGKLWDAHVPGFVPRPPELPATEPQMGPVEFNTITPGRKRRRPDPQAFLEEAPSPDPRTEARSSAAPTPPPRTLESRGSDAAPTTATELDEMPNPKAERLRLLREGLGKQYLQADDKYHFRDRNREVAFEAQEKKLVTRFDSPSVVSSMIDLAETRGWSSLKLTGTAEFRREAWFQASMRDLEVSGYKPSDLDKARLAEARAERLLGAPANTIAENLREPGRRAFKAVPEEGRSEDGLGLTPKQDQFIRVMEATMKHRGDSPDAIARARTLAAERLTSDRIHVGTLVEAGTAPYQNRRDQKLSHYVTLRDDAGQVSKVWGVDLPRALDESGARPGEVIAVAFRGRKPVAVDVPVKDDKGETIRTERQTVERNRWEIVPFDRLREDARVAVRQAVARQDNPVTLRVFDRKAAPAPASTARESAPSRPRERQR